MHYLERRMRKPATSGPLQPRPHDAGSGLVLKKGDAMTVQEWLECTDPGPMLNLLRGKASERKLRLFGVACCRRIWHLITDELSRSAVQEAERYADGSTSNMAELKTIFSRSLTTSWIMLAPAELAIALAIEGTMRIERIAAWKPVLDKGPWRPVLASSDIESAAIAAHAVEMSVRIAHCALAREIFGNPFRPVAVAPARLTPKTVRLAQDIYDDRAFERLPSLANVLEEGGCHDAEVLDHCRGPGPHVRGCWVVDAILGKE